MSYILEEFVTTNQYNVQFEVPQSELDEMMIANKHNFESNIEYNLCNNSAEPIFVYERAGEPIAWYNFETMTGFIKV
jgi:hypothetical protein